MLHRFSHQYQYCNAGILVSQLSIPWQSNMDLQGKLVTEKAKKQRQNSRQKKNAEFM